ncbi:proteobacterial dedicated sortase system response regulator [Candidatus Albibeggiatoa sp. nov. BB20]|uniref:proteobacterial dedicated sortase system response regulator n=1 Tax=Candidatus Albibeggiatoa sp. nov. BB20 TaxID=3162723 RepID=UPI0033657C53
MGRRIAIVEDEPAIRENYAVVLRRQGYDVNTYINRPQALAAFQIRLPELVLLDIGLEDEVEGGFDLCREIRAMSHYLPIIFLTARDSEFDTVSGLRLGADDYLNKDISMPHLLARIAALFRRVDALRMPASNDSLIERGSLSIDSNRLTITWKSITVDLTLTEFWIVYSLTRYPGHVKQRDQLMKEANVQVDDSTITSHIKRIRKKFLTIDPKFSAIETIYGMGYRWKSEDVP